jgi:HAD superfamily hydrolase (TIGR01459 family)
LSGEPSPIRIGGIREIIGRFRTWFVDAYGVLHDGSAAFPGVIGTLARARQAGAKIVIVTNSAQRVDAVAARLGDAGIAAGSYDHVMSSGELSWRYIETLNAEGPAPRRLFLLRDGAGPFWLKHLPNPIVEEVAEADLIVAAGMPHRTEEAARASDLMTILETGIAARLPLLVADSDETYPHNGMIRLGPGWIARRYIELGGEAIEFGKPHAPIFTAASNLCRAQPGEAIMVGDNLATDIAGAGRMGLASLLVLNGGVHGGLRDAELAEAARRHGAWPTYIAPGFVW